MNHSNTPNWAWPEPPLGIVLVHPEIPPNTGNISRLCAGTRTQLHLVEPMGFRITDREVKRAGLDYWDSVDITTHSSLEAFETWAEGRRMLLFSTKGKETIYNAPFKPGDLLVFGCETKGLPPEFMEKHKEAVYTLPMDKAAIRSHNLSNTAAIVLYEALRQLQQFPTANGRE